MKRSYINTKKIENGLTNNNGYHIPNFSANTQNEYYSTSTTYNHIFHHEKVVNNYNFYSINIDWLQFICTSTKSMSEIIVNNIDRNIFFDRIEFHHNVNFKKLHKVFIDGDEICEIYSEPNNSSHKKNEFSIKVNNHILYQNNGLEVVDNLIHNIGLNFNRISRIDIALDGADILKIINMLIKYSKSANIQCNNDKIEILPTAFKKKEHKWLSWSIGNIQSGISATVYDKKKEILTSNKNYINNYWNSNKIDTNSVGRFEVKLTYRKLRKYKIDNIICLSSAEFIGTIFQKEVKNWLRFYRVRKKDIDNHKKETAIKRGHEIKFIKWNKLPKQVQLIENRYVSTSTYFNARNNISYLLKEIKKYPDDDMTTEIKTVKNIAVKYDLVKYLENKTNALFGVGHEDILKNLLYNSDL